MKGQHARGLAAALMIGAGLMGTTTIAAAADFDRAAWATGRGDDSGRNPRGSLVGALRSSGAVNPGTPRAQVRALLGEPENVDGAREMYSLGTGYGASLEYFSVEYDAEGRVARASVRRG